MKVDLPQPLGPRMATCSPCAMERVIPERATRSSRRTLTLWSSISGVNPLFYRRVIAQAPVRAQRGQAARGQHLDQNAVVLAVALAARRRVAQDVAVAQLDTDFAGDIGQLDDV